MLLTRFRMRKLKPVVIFSITLMTLLINAKLVDGMTSGNGHATDAIVLHGVLAASRFFFATVYLIIAVAKPSARVVLRRYITCFLFTGIAFMTAAVLASVAAHEYPHNETTAAPMLVDGYLDDEVVGAAGTAVRFNSHAFGWAVISLAIVVELLMYPWGLNVPEGDQLPVDRGHIAERNHLWVRQPRDAKQSYWSFGA